MRRAYLIHYSHGLLTSGSYDKSINDAAQRGASLGSIQTNFMTDVSIEDVPPPAYSDIYGRVDLAQDGLNTVAKVSGGVPP